MVPNKIHPALREGREVIWMALDTDRTGSSTMNGDNRYVAMLNSGSGRRIFDNNWFDNEWNSDNRFLFVRKSLHVFTNALILWMGVVLFAGIFASYQYPFQFRLRVLQVLHISSDPNSALPMQPA